MAKLNISLYEQEHNIQNEHLFNQPPVVEKQRIDLGLLSFLWVISSIVGPFMFYATFGAHWGESFYKAVQPSIESESLTCLLISVINITLIIIFVKGFKRLFFGNVTLGPYYGNSSRGLSNIEDAYRYRNSKMAMMDNETAAKFQMETSSLNNVFMNERATSFMNSKIAMMDNETKLNTLKGK